MVLRRLSDVWGHTPEETRRRSRRCVVGSAFLCPQKLINPIDLPSGGGNVETLGTSKHRPHFGFDL
jgi:hypothetical protein